MSDPIVIVSAARTAMGSFQGGFSGLTAANLGANANATLGYASRLLSLLLGRGLQVPTHRWRIQPRPRAMAEQG